jgi:hypothetical protein
MLSNDPTEPQSSPLSDAKAGAVEVSPLKPQDPIEVGTGGNGTTTDPGGTDVRPPCYGDLELLA